MNKTISIIVIIIIIVLGAILIVRNTEDSQVNENRENNTPAQNAGATNNSTSTTPAGDVKEFVVTGNNFSFAPSTLTVKKGDRVRVVFKNTVGFHDFVIDEFQAATKKINAGQEDVIEFVADKAGSFEYYCSVGTHRQMGMKGTLVVQE
jgi:plastocyanin